MLPPGEQPLRFLAACDVMAGEICTEVVVVRDRHELVRLLSAPPPGLRWIRAVGLLQDPDAWAMAAQGGDEIPIDVVLSDPASEFPDLYRLVDVRSVRDVRVTIPVAPGFPNALRLAASVGIPVKLVLGQPTQRMVGELCEALSFCLYDSQLETAVEPFHSLFATFIHGEATTLWTILEEDPGEFQYADGQGGCLLPRSTKSIPMQEATGFVGSRLQQMIQSGGECAECAWQRVCAGYFKWPDAAYDCSDVKELFSQIRAAADEIGRDLAEYPEAIASQIGEGGAA